MVPSLEYLARNVVFETAIKQNMRYKSYILISEHIDQYALIIEKKFILLKTHKLGIETLLIF